MALAALLTAHNLAHTARNSSSLTSASLVCATLLPTISEDTQLEGSAVENDSKSSPGLSVSPSFCSATSLSSCTAPSFDSTPQTPIDGTPLDRVPLTLASGTGLPVRPNEHLAISTPRQLWKSDCCTDRCNAIECRRRFSILSRKHHCRKCGDIFCGTCSSKVTPLLDTTHLGFLHPPRGVPITAFESELSPVVLERVCDTCFYLINGRPESSSQCSAGVNTTASSISSVQAPPERRPRLRRSNTDLSPRKSRSYNHCLPRPPIAPTPDPSFGELDLYPLSRHSSICKATGGGRWTPKPINLWEGHRIPGGLNPSEEFVEKEAEKERLRKLNPIIRNGEFQMRKPLPREPIEERKEIVPSMF